MLRSTIDSTAMKSSITNANLFLDLASEVIDDRRAGADLRRQKRKSRQKTKSPEHEEAPAISAPIPTHLPAAPSSSEPQDQSLGSLMSNQYVLYGLGFGAVVFLALIAFIFFLGSRVSFLESQFAKIHLDENVVSRVAFLEYFVSQLHKNITGSVRLSLGCVEFLVSIPF